MYFIIRQSGERTATPCISFHRDLFSDMRTVVHGDSNGSNFENLIDLLQHMGRHSQPCLMIDADIFVLDRQPMLDAMSSINHRHHVKFLVHCRFFGKVYRGAYAFSEELVHLMAKKAAERDFDVDDPLILQRPSRYFVEEGLRQLGRNPADDGSAAVVGIHDFAQFRLHIFHKMVYRAWRERPEDIANWSRQWKASPDPELQVAAAGLSAGQLIRPFHAGRQHILGAFDKLGIGEVSQAISPEEWDALPEEFYKYREGLIEATLGDAA